MYPFARGLGVVPRGRLESGGTMMQSRRRVMLRWARRVILGVMALVVAALCAGVAYEQWSRWRIARDFPPPGRLIEHAGRLSHLLCTGDGSPTVILEAGLDTDGSQTWAGVQPEIAEHTRVCSYDRAGILWSEPREEPRDADRIAGELHGLLDAAAEPPPYVMVAHSLGGPLVRVYSERFPGEVAGFVFVDAAHPEQYSRYPDEVLQVFAAVDSQLPNRRFMKISVTTGMYRLVTPSREDPVGAYLWRTVPWGFSGEREARDATFHQAGATGTLGDRPLVVLTAGVGPRLPGVRDEVQDAFYETWLVLQAELAALSTNSAHRIVDGATHYIHHDEPDTVVAAVRDVVDAVRGGMPVR